MNKLPVELEFSVEQLRRHLEENPHDAAKLAISHFEDFSILTIEFKKLEMQRQALEIENVKLRSAKVSLPSFLIKNRGAK